MSDSEVVWNWNPEGYGHNRWPRHRPTKKDMPVVPSTFKDLKLGVLSERWTFDENILPTVEDLGGKKGVRISGIAAMGNVVSRNNRKYLEEELVKSARTWFSKPITINHSPPREGMPGFDRSKIVGDIRWMEHEDGKMKYAGVVTKEPYVTLLRNRSTEIRKVSIEADYLTNECPSCGKFFPTDKAFYEHAAQDHFNKNLTQVPRGIIGSALSLLLNAEPGIEGTTVELREMLDGIKPFAQLAEALITFKEGKLEPQKIVQTVISKDVAAKEAVIREPCSPELKACVDDLVAKGVPEDHAWPICRSQLGESACLPITDEDTIRVNSEILLHAPSPYKEAFEKFLKPYDKKFVELTQRAEAAEKKVGLTEMVTEQTSLKETVDSQHKTILQLETELCRREGLVEANSKLQIENDNVRDKLRGNFKGRAKDVKTREPDLTWKP
jgi:regulator of replication initiation timing